MTGPFRARWLGASALPLLMVLAGQAIAQEAAEDAAPKFETVYVEARKRVEDQQTVPISLNAYNQDDLDQLGVKTIEDLRYSSPSLYIAPTTFRQDTLNITIRGQRNFDSPSGGGNSGLSFDTATAVYKDGVYYARAIGLGGSLFDVESVQVLKGPQGTLVGRNSTGGALLYQSKEPSGDYEAMVRTTLGDYGHAGLQGVINLPLSDTVSFRMALNADNEKGYISNHYYDPSSGMTNTQPAMGSNKLAALLSLKWQPSDDFKVLLRADLAAEHDTGSTYHDRDRQRCQQRQSFTAGLQRVVEHAATRPDRGLLERRTGGEQPGCRPLPDLFGHGRQVVRRYRRQMGDGLPHLGQYRPGDQPRPGRGDEHLQVQHPQLPFLAERTDVQRQRLQRPGEMDRRPVLFQRVQPQ